MVDGELGPMLLAIARSAIAARLDLPRSGEPRDPALLQPAATFVTLKRFGELRGCIGSLEPVRSLRDDVSANAVAAAFRDPRFAPLQACEFASTSVEVSVLSANERLVVADEAELAARLRPGVDGAILEFEGRRATFLPQVWEAIPDPREFLVALKRKAGWSDRFWSPRVNVFRYRVTKWAEREILMNAD